ncbi:MAG: hypothetical protein ABGY43_10575 [bacterium]
MEGCARGLGVISCVTAFVNIPGFWSSYLFDIVFPAYLYICFRGLFLTAQHDSQILGYFSADAMLAIVVAVTFIMETSQYFGIYKGFFDPLDYLAYLSLLVPRYVFDIRLSRRRRARDVFVSTNK